jgi:hypothetical protein
MVYVSHLIENLLDRDDHIICVLLIKHSLKVTDDNLGKYRHMERVIFFLHR